MNRVPIVAAAIIGLLLATIPSGGARPEGELANSQPTVPTEITYTVPADYDTFVQWWQALETQYPNYLSMWSPNQQYGLGQVPSSSVHGPYDLYMVRLTNESLGLAKPEVFFAGNPHGDERAGPIGAYWFVDWLLRHAFDDAWNTPYDDYLRWLLDNREVYFLVSHNPDGFDRIRRCDANNIDLNREADHDGPEGPGSCPNGALNVFSSVQGRTVARFLDEHQIRTGMDFHGGTRALLYPWGSTRSSVSAVSPVTGRSWNYAPPDFYYFDVFSHRMGDFMGDYDGAWNGNFGIQNVGTPPGIVGYVARGTYLGWAYGADTVDNPMEAPYVDNGPYPGAGALWITPEISTVKNPPQSYYGGDDTLGFGIDVRRMLLAMIDVAQPYVRWHPSGASDGFPVQQGHYFDLAWQVNGSLVVDATRVQWGSVPDPVANPSTILPEHTDFAGQYFGGTGWEGALDGRTSGWVWTERLRAPSAVGTYYYVARARVDERYSQVLAPATYGSESYLRIVKERTMPGFAEDLLGADGLEHMEYTEWWDSPVLRIEVVPDSTPPVITLRSPPNGAVIRAGTPLDFDVFDGTLASVTASIDGDPPAPLPMPWDVSTAGWADGPHAVRIVATDLGGLTTTGDYSFVLDSTPPTIALVSPAAGSVIAGGSVIDLDVADPHLTMVTWTRGGPATGLPPPFDLDTTGWPEGASSVQVTAFDQAGNWDRRTYGFTVDATAPVVTLVSPAANSVFRSSTVLDFSITDASTVTATVDDGTGPRGLAAPYDVSTAGKPDGPLSVTIAATDAVGHTTNATYAFTIDNLGPQLGIRSPAGGAVVHSGIAIDVDVDDPNLASVTYDAGFGPTPLAAPYDIPTTGWAEGTYTVSVQATDAAGNTATTGITITIDDTSPRVTRLDTGHVVRPGRLLSFSVQEPNLWTVLWDAGGPVTPLAAPYGIDTAGWADGDYAVTVRGIDLAGNEGSVVVSMTIDGTSPDVAVVGWTGTAVVRPGFVVQFAITDAHLDSATGDITPGAGANPFPPPYEVDTAVWADGSYEIRVTAVDLAGNERMLRVTIEIDGTPPIIGEPFASDAVVGSTMPVTATVTDAHGPASVQVHWRLVGGSWEAIAMTDGVYGEWTATIPASSAPGTVELYVSAADDLGNEAQTSPMSIEVTARPSTPSSGLPAWLLALLIVIVLAVVVAVLVLRRRQRSS